MSPARPLLFVLLVGWTAACGGAEAPPEPDCSLRLIRLLEHSVIEYESGHVEVLDLEGALVQVALSVTDADAVSGHEWNVYHHARYGHGGDEYNFADE